MTTTMFFDDFQVGQIFQTAARTVTETDVINYAGLSGDFNPLHTDEEFARTTPFGTRIAHGPLVLCIAMGLVNRLGVTDGTSLGMLSIETWTFNAPVGIGDTISAEVETVGQRLTSKGDRGILHRAVRVKNQHGAVVQAGVIVTMAKAKNFVAE